MTGIILFDENTIMRRSKRVTESNNKYATNTSQSKRAKTTNILSVEGIRGISNIDLTA